MTTTSMNIHFRPSRREGRHPGRLFIRIIHKRRSSHIATDYTLYPDEWDAQERKVVYPADTAGCPRAGLSADSPTNRLPDDTAGGSGRHRCDQLSLIEESMTRDLKRLHEIAASLDESGAYTSADVSKRFGTSLDRQMVYGYAGITADRLRESGRERTARAYRSAARSMTLFNEGRDVLLTEIDTGLIKAYEQYLLEKGLKMNTVSFYLRNLRALYFRAVAEGVITRRSVNPFAGLHTGVYETRRRALDGEQLRALAKLEEILSDKPEEYDKAAELKDSLLYFMFCYHARGMSFVDMAHLRRDGMAADSFAYRRRKTGGMLEVKITAPMKRILSHFAGKATGSDYVFPVIDEQKGNVWRQYETGLKRQNKSLKELAEMAGIDETLSTHVARHTWATLAKRLNVPVGVISEALGHRDVKTTGIYLASFDRSTMDELSAKMSAVIKAA